MMKKCLALGLALLYTVTVLGFAINFHYCFNRVSGVTVNQPVKMCTSQKLAKAPKCCKDRYIDIKVKDGHQASALSFSAKSVGLEIPLLGFSKSADAFTSSPNVTFLYRGPPIDLSSQPALFLSNNNFRI